MTQGGAVLRQVDATQALTSLALGDVAGARAAAARAAASLWRLPPVMNMMMPHLASLCDVYLALGERAGKSVDASVARAAPTACRSLRKFARVFPIVAPIVGVYEGRLARLQGRNQDAYRRWYKALAEAQRLNMPTEPARAALAQSIR